MLIFICAVKHLLDFVNGLSQEIYVIRKDPFDAQSSLCFTLILHRNVLVVSQAATLSSVQCSKSLPPSPPARAEQHSSLFMAFGSFSPGSELSIQVYNNPTVLTCALLIEDLPVSKASLCHTAQLL